MSSISPFPHTRQRSWSSPGFLEGNPHPGARLTITTKSLQDVELRSIPDNSPTMELRISRLHFEACLLPLPPSPASSNASRRSLSKSPPLTRRPSNSSQPSFHSQLSFHTLPTIPQGKNSTWTHSPPPRESPELRTPSPPESISLNPKPTPPPLQAYRYSSLLDPSPEDPNYEPGPLTRTHDRDSDPVIKTNTTANTLIAPPLGTDLTLPKPKGPPPKSVVSFSPRVELKDLDDTVEVAGILRPPSEGLRGRIKERVLQTVGVRKGRRVKVAPVKGNGQSRWESWKDWRAMRRWRKRGPEVRMEKRGFWGWARERLSMWREERGELETIPEEAEEEEGREEEGEDVSPEKMREEGQAMREEEEDVRESRVTEDSEIRDSSDLS